MTRTVAVYRCRVCGHRHARLTASAEPADDRRLECPTAGANDGCGRVNRHELLERRAPAGGYREREVVHA